MTDGPAILDDFIKAFYAIWSRDTPPTLSTYLRSKAKVPLTMQAHVARFLLRPCTKTMPAIVEFALRVVEANGGDPQERQEKLDDLFRLTVDFTLAYLDGQSASKLQRLLRRPPQGRKDRGVHSFDPQVPIDVSMLTARFTWPTDEQSKELMGRSEPLSVEAVEQLAKMAVAERASALPPPKRKVEPHVRMVELSELDGMLPCTAFGSK